MSGLISRGRSSRTVFLLIVRLETLTHTTQFLRAQKSIHLRLSVVTYPYPSGIKLLSFSRTCERRLKNMVRHGLLVQLNTTLGCGSDVVCFIGGVLRNLRDLDHGFRAYALVR